MGLAGFPGETNMNKTNLQVRVAANEAPLQGVLSQAPERGCPTRSSQDCRTNEIPQVVGLSSVLRLRQPRSGGSVPMRLGKWKSEILRDHSQSTHRQ
jgi:hypothetical protein